MIITVDIGNTNITFGVFDNDDIVFVSRLATQRSLTPDQYAVYFSNIFDLHKVDTSLIDGAIISSVVPELTQTLRQAISPICEKCIVIAPGVKTGLDIQIDNPAQLGADLVVGAVAAKEKYPLPIIIFDLGTATTGSVIDKNGNFIGGIITTGIKTSINALSAGAALLPQIDISAPKKVIGTNSIESMRSGAVIGTACMLDGLIERFEDELGERATVIVTGGLGKTVARNCKREVIIDENLLIDGLKIIYDKNKN